MELDQIIHHFRIIAAHPLRELDGTLYEMEHQTSGAKLVWLARAEENKTFGIAFRTVPSDDTGVFHILEHSVLCGSTRYPIKDPFVELVKGSMNTFLNAMTFSDKTVYPVSSKNDKDFLNLMRVYMDAVLHPLIYDHPEAFWQEGWRYELSAQQNAPVYTGVVFNEMKGVMASPDELMSDELTRRLFPDTCYRFVSGGDPAHIPELTYEHFLDTHRKFYHPSNSHIILDGKVDIETVLSILDREYLGSYQRQIQHTEIPMQKAIDGGESTIYYELSQKESLSCKARIAWGFGLSDYTCREEVVALRVLSNVLCGSNRSPLKQAILGAKLGQDVSLQVADGIQQPFAVLEIRNLDESRSDEIRQTIQDTLRDCIRKGLDKEHLTSALANLEFSMRERDFGAYPQGLGLGLNILESWLYGGNPAANLSVDALFTSLREKVQSDYFETLLSHTFLENKHHCQVTLLPSHEIGAQKKAEEDARLAAIGDRWSVQDYADVSQRLQRLTTWQSTADTPQAIASLPHLALSDISPQPETIPENRREIQGVPLLSHPVSTNGVSYWNLYFDVSDLPEEQLSTVSFLCALLGNLDTAAHSSLQLQQLKNLYTGNLSFSVEAYAPENRPETCRALLCVSLSALKENLSMAARLATEILLETQFDDTARILELLCQNRVGAEQTIINAGHRVAMARVFAAFSADALVNELAGGFSYCRYLKDLEQNYTQNAAKLTQTLTALSHQIFTRDILTIGTTGATESEENMLCEELFSKLPATSRRSVPCLVRPQGSRQEGIILPADTGYSFVGGNLVPCNRQYSGGAKAVGRIVSLSYLWNTIRMQGGAYGTGLILQSNGNIGFYSYRDPNVARSLTCYNGISDFLRTYAATEQDLSGFIIGAISETEGALLPKQQGKMAETQYFLGASYADRRRIRQAMLHTTRGDLLTLADALEELKRMQSTCVIGSKDQVTACGLADIYTL